MKDGYLSRSRCHLRGDDLVLRLAALAYLARFSAVSRIHTKSDLRLYFYWCTDHQTSPLTVARTEIERYMRWMQETGHFKPATVARRLALFVGVLPHLRHRRRPGPITGGVRAPAAGVERVTDTGAFTPAIRSPAVHRAAPVRTDRSSAGGRATNRDHPSPSSTDRRTNSAPEPAHELSLIAVRSKPRPNAHSCRLCRAVRTGHAAGPKIYAQRSSRPAERTELPIFERFDHHCELASPSVKRKGRDSSDCQVIGEGTFNSAAILASSAERCGPESGQNGASLRRPLNDA